VRERLIHMAVVAVEVAAEAELGEGRHVLGQGVEGEPA